MRFPNPRWLMLGLALLGAGRSDAAELTIAAAADLKFAMDELVAGFKDRDPGTNVKVTYGSSGNFFAQLQNRAPFDLYFSADIEYPRKLANDGHALGGDVFLYAFGRIVIWAPKSSPVDVEKLGVQALLDSSIKKVAVANPQHAPYGRAAVAALKSLNVYDSVEAKLVYGENIVQAAQFVQSGAADIGVLALSLAVAPQMRDAGRYWEIPLASYSKMEQGGVILRWTREPEAAKAFREYVLGGKGRETLKQYGFFLPEN